MRNDKLSIQSMDFAVQIINLVKKLKEKRESIISSQIGEAVLRSAQTSEKRNMPTERLILLPDFKLPLKKPTKRDIGLNFFAKQIILPMQNMNPLTLLVQAFVSCSLPYSTPQRRTNDEKAYGCFICR